MKKKLSLILALLMISSSVIACSNNNADDTSNAGNSESKNPVADDSATAEENGIEITDDLPEIKFGGAEFMIYNSCPETNTWNTTVYVDFDEDSAEVIPSAIYNRNAQVEERFDVTISETYSSATDINTMLTAGGDGIDLTLLDGSDVVSFMNRGLLYNLNELDNIDLTKPYWDQNAQKYLSLAGKYFEGVGDFMTTHIDETVCMYFNKKLVEDYHLEDPYSLVDDYKWTYDKMHELGVKVLEDSNGDGVRNDLDQFAVISWSGVLYPYFIYGSGETYVDKDENDIPYTSYFNERFIGAFENILRVLHSEGDTFTYDANVITDTKGLGHRIQEVMFPNNQALFWVECVSWARALREMEADFGIITAPMYTEDQGQYYNFCNGNFFGECIPVTLTGDDLNRTTIITEALNSQSSGVLDAYYDISLKGRNSRDEESGRMLDLIFANRVYDVSIVFDVGAINGSFCTMGANNDTDVASYHRRNEKVTSKLIDNLMKNIAE